MAAALSRASSAATTSRLEKALLGCSSSRGASAAKRSLLACGRAAKRRLKSVRWLQAHTTAVRLTLATEQPALLQACAAVLNHRQVGTGTMEGQEKDTVEPPLPGPHMKLLLPRLGPQLVLSV
jgi:hypothetical protein